MHTPYANLVFGVYPGGECGSGDGLAAGPPDDPVRTLRCLAELQGESKPFVIRVYERFSGRGDLSPFPAASPSHYERYLGPGRLLDLVLMFQSPSGDVAAYRDFAAELAGRHANHLYSVQVTEEASFTDGPGVIDGPYPNVQRALVEGVVAVKDTLRRLGKYDVKVGFNATPTFGPSVSFWSGIGALGREGFHTCLDYAGLDFFPDVFASAAPDGQPGDLRASVRSVLETMRNEWLPAAGIGSGIPIHITEHGWPTGPERSYERQAQVLETVIRTVEAERRRLNIARYTLFGLRDSDSSNPDVADNVFYHFGITRDDYSPKPAYEVFRKLVRELGAR